MLDAEYIDCIRIINPPLLSSTMDSDDEDPPCLVSLEEGLPQEIQREIKVPITIVTGK
jgi:hypothetical protein